MCHSDFVFSFLLKKGEMAKLYPRDMREREMFKNFILSQRAGKTHYLYSETATYINSGEDIS